MKGTVNRWKKNQQSNQQKAESMNNSANEPEHDPTRNHNTIQTFNVDHNIVSNFESFGVVESKLTEKPTNSKRTMDVESPDKLETNKKLKANIDSISELVNKITGK